MKKLLIITIILCMSFSLLAETLEELGKRVDILDYEISCLVEKTKASIKKKGWKTKDIAWTATYRLLSVKRFSVDLIAGQKYIFYTMTTGPKIKVCLERKGQTFNCTYSKSKNSIYFFKSRYTGKHYFRVIPLSRKKGLHISYLTKINKEY